VIAEEKRIDSWFLCIAPLDYPQLAMAVIVEGGGYGSRAAAPIAAALVLKAKDLGLLGNIQGAPTNGQPQPQQPQRQAQPNGVRQQPSPRPGQTQPTPRPSQPRPTPRAVAVRQ
jgi:penicillin-binding protein 2